MLLHWLTQDEDLSTPTASDPADNHAGASEMDSKVTLLSHPSQPMTFYF